MITNNTTTYKLKAGQGSKSSPPSEEDAVVAEEVAESDGQKYLYVPGKLRLAKNLSGGVYIGKGSGNNSRNEQQQRNQGDRRNKCRRREFQRDARAKDEWHREQRDYGYEAVSLFPYAKFGGGAASEAEKKEKEMKFNLPEDTRISKLLRRLSVEEEPENSLQISRKLLEVLMLPENATYVRKSFVILRDSMLHILQVAPGPAAKKQCARAFGRIGYIMAGDTFDFAKYVKVIMKFNTNNAGQTGKEEMICLFMEALKETLAMEKKNSVLDKARMYSLMQELNASIEPTDNAEVFNLILDNLMTSIEFYPANFNKFFKDTIDLLFGWHVDHNQPLSNIQFISQQLERVSGHFQLNLDFSITLLVHFVEDIETYSAQMGAGQEEYEGESVEHVTVYILALNTVLKCLQGSKNLLKHAMFNKKFISDAIKQIHVTIRQSVDIKVYDNLIIAGNESVALLLGFYNTIQQSSEIQAPPSEVINPEVVEHNDVEAQPKSETTLLLYKVQENIFSLVDLELSHVECFTNSTIVSMLMLISKVIKELSADLEMELIPKLVGPESAILQLRYLPYRDIQEALIVVYQALLNLKNIPLLQEVYRFWLGDLQVSYRPFIDDDEGSETFTLIENNPFDVLPIPDNPQWNCLFLLRCLSQLANDSVSIVGMWILKPSVLELLGVSMKVHNPKLAQYPILQMCVLNLLHSHCKCYNYFISKSNLLNTPLEFGGWSPTSNNFAIILDVLQTTFKSLASAEAKLLILQCIEDIASMDTYVKSLCGSEEFMALTEVMLANAYAKDQRIVLKVAQNLEKLLSNRHHPWRNDFLLEVNKLCVLHMASTNRSVRECYTKLSGWLPWDVTILEGDTAQFRNLSDDGTLSGKDSSMKSLKILKRLHMNGTVFGEMSAHSFKQFMNYLLKNEPPFENFLQNVFLNSWPLESDLGASSEEYRDLTLNSRHVLYSWATWEAAQLCVNGKLRTPLGKPNETFTSFENALKQLARDVMKIRHEGGKSHVGDTRVRLLLQFIEHLEMAIYNASEGTAVAIPPPQKPVRTFFCTNASTCREWLSRIRIILVQLALHAGMCPVAVRHGQQLIADMHKTGKVETLDFERAVVYLTMGLLNLNESEAIMGLYVWCKNLNRKFDWIKYAGEQANKKYESAAAGYQKIIDVCGPTLDIYVRNFINDQIVQCYKQLNSWLDIVQYRNGKMNVLLSEGENGMRYNFNTVNFDCAQSIFNLETSTHAFEELTSWKELDHARDSWSSYDALLTAESDLYQVALNVVASENQLLNATLEKQLSKIRTIMQENVLFAPVQFHQDFTLMHYVAAGLQNAVNNVPSAGTTFLVSENFEMDVEKIDCSILSKILWWTEYFNNLQSQHLGQFCNNLRLNIIRKSRKEGNVSTATAQLYRFLTNKNLLSVDDHAVGAGTGPNLLMNVSDSFKRRIPGIIQWDLDEAKAAQEVIKLLYEETSVLDGCSPKKMAFDICAIASKSMFKCADIHSMPELKQVSTRILLNLGSWLQTTSDVPLTDLTTPLGKLLMVLPEIGIENIGNNIIPVNEMMIGKLLQFSVNQCPSLAKGWHAFGTWCYRWGRKIVDNSADLSKTLTLEDKALIHGLLPIQEDSPDYDRVISILSQTRAYVDEEDIDSNEIHTSDMIRNQLKNVSSLCNSSEDLFEKLVDVWRNLQKRVYAYYEHSVEAYFKYLHLATQSENISKATESNTVTVTLRLLRLVVKHALELQSALEKGLTSTPTHPWKIIIPQLFSRLNHPESYVRERVSELLCRVAEDAPHLITFPAVVGALEGGVNFDFSEISLPKDCLSQDIDPAEDTELNDIEDDTYESDDESKNVLQACFKSMVETLSKQAPETITQVQTLVKELRRIILLWDELWLGTLAQHHSEINKRQQQLEFEIAKVNQNSYLFPEQKLSLITEKHRIIIKPIIFILEQLYDITSVEPETPHEKYFQDKFLPLIQNVLQKLKNPENPEEPQESWKLLKELQNQFQQKAHKRSILKMDNISPILAKIKDTLISMPGQDNSRFVSTKVYVSHVSNQVSILPTKTKPKKLIFYGSDGHSYTYLFKGLEDLHLDERIMQFLSIANTMMAQNTEGTGHNLYRARHYSVIPLGPRSGLISWVGGTTPAFALYKRWQQREATKSAKNTGTVSRPSELFYSKLNPLLQEHGVKNIDNRKEWPLVVLKQVLTELMAETPSDLLAREFWCHAVSPGAWWQIVRKYSYSVAVMSIIGYIIGLGDRHLDNVLVDLNTGEVVHIDYNVCFEKGKTLRVPEKVPFRLTPNIRDALGVTGVEGMFRLACENILKTMKKGRETLLTLLEAFVYDPLVDWTVGNDGLVGTTFGGMSTSATHRQTRKDLEKEMTLAMYRVRCTEVKSEWDFNKCDIAKLIPELYALMDTWCDVQKQSISSEDLLQDLHQQMALVKEAEANGPSKHNLQSLPLRFESVKKTRDAFTQAKSDLEKLEQDCTNHIQHYEDSMKMIQNQQVQQWYQELSASAGNTVKTFDIVKEFLQNAGQTNMIAQCDQIETEVLSTHEQQILLAQKCLNLLQEYWVIFIQSPPSFTEEHRIHYYLKWAKILLNSEDVKLCEPIYQQFYTFLNMVTKPINSIIAYNFKLTMLYNNMAAKVTKAYEDLNNIRTEEPRVLEKHYTEAKLCLLNFVKREKQAPKALEFVIVSELLVLNRTFLTLETAASKTGDWLIKLTSRDGDWFLDELTLSCGKAIELISYLQLDDTTEDANFLRVFDGLVAANNLYKSLHELNFNFHTIILPESIKKLQSEEVSVMAMIHELNDIVISVGPLQELALQMEKNLTCVVMEMEYGRSDLLEEKMATLKNQYQILLQSSSNMLTPGKMLLMGFNGLFDKLHLECNNVVNLLGNLNVPASWRKLDQVREAKSLAAPIFNPKVHSILNDIFLLKRLQTMCEFFALCLEVCRSFKGQTENVVMLDDEHLLKPIRKFIADFISRQFLGITTEAIAYAQCHLLQRLGLDVSNEIEQKDIGAENKVPLDELYQKGWNIFLKNGTFSQNVLAQASSVESNLKNAWEKIQEPKKLEKTVTLLQSSLTRLQNQLTVHNWLHEEVLQQSDKCSYMRTKFIVEMGNKSTSLSRLQTKSNEMCDKQKTLIASISQRLKWAAGANPDLNETLAQFERTAAAREEKFRVEQQVCTLALTTCTNILRYELLRCSTPESKACDQIFLRGYEKWIAACRFSSVKHDAVSHVEENIMKFYSPDMENDAKWLLKVSDKISDTITDTQAASSELKEKLFAAAAKIAEKLEALKLLYNKHCNVMNDFKTLIKAMMKIDESVGRTQQFVYEYRQYVENFASVFHHMKKELTLDEMAAMRRRLGVLEKDTEAVYRELLELEGSRAEKEDLVGAALGRKQLVRQEGVSLSPVRAMPGKQESMTKGQQRNAYAVGVWRRVRMKLEGKDPDPGRKYTTQEQVDYVIREATSVDNLALLYEGWTPWV